MFADQVLSDHGIGQSVGTAVPANVLAGQTFSSTTQSNAIGTMPNKVGSATTLTPGTSVQAFPQGYYSGSASDGKVAAVTGTANTAQVLTGYTFSSANGISLTGGMQNNGSPTLGPGSITPGYYTGGTITGNVSANSNITAYTISSGSGNWTVPAGVSEVMFEMWGGGGGGGVGSMFVDNDRDATVICSAGGGGGGGAYILGLMSVTPGQQIAYSCANYSNGGGSVGASGSSGGNTTFSTATAYGGGGGLSATGANNVYAYGGWGGGITGVGTAGSGGSQGGLDTANVGCGYGFSPTFPGITVIRAMGGGGGGPGAGYIDLSGSPGGSGGSGSIGGGSSLVGGYTDGSTSNALGQGGTHGSGGAGGSYSAITPTAGTVGGGGGGGNCSGYVAGYTGGAAGGAGQIIVYYPTPIGQGTATTAQVLAGYSFSSSGGTNQNGAISSVAAASIVPGTVIGTGIYVQAGTVGSAPHNSAGQTFTSNGTFTVPAGVSQLTLLICGGGAGGSGGYIFGGQSNEYSVKSGGNSGAIGLVSFPVVPGWAFAVNIGAGGAMGIGGTAGPGYGSGATPGGNGGSTSFVGNGISVSAAGGIGGDGPEYTYSEEEVSDNGYYYTIYLPNPTLSVVTFSGVSNGISYANPGGYAYPVSSSSFGVGGTGAPSSFGIGGAPGLNGGYGAGGGGGGCVIISKNEHGGNGGAGGQGILQIWY